MVLIFMGIVSIYTPLAFDRIAQRWFTLPNFYFLWPVPLLTALLSFLLWRWIDGKHDALPFIAAIALFFLGYLGLASQIFMLIGTLFLLPIILGYVIFIYWLFRGKVKEGESYH